MKILAFDTSTDSCSIALLLNKTVKKVSISSPMNHGELILPSIDKLLAENKISLSEIDALGFSAGPGSFTGIRIACSVAQGLGFALNKPIIPVSSLAVLAQSAYIELKWKNLCVVTQAGRNEMYYAFYVIDSNGIVSLRGKEERCPIDNLTYSALTPLLTTEWYVIGNGWKNNFTKLEPLINFNLKGYHDNIEPQAEAILSLISFKFEQGYWIKAEETTPVYLNGDNF